MRSNLKQSELVIPPGHRAITTALPNDLVDSIIQITQARGMRFGAYVELALRAMPKEPEQIWTKTKMPLGKYRGSLAGDVAKADPNYIIWLSNNVSKIVFADEVIAIAAAFADQEQILD